jgi:hypothetical protein
MVRAKAGTETSAEPQRLPPNGPVFDNNNKQQHTKERNKMKTITNAKLVTLSQAYKYMSGAMVLAILGWVIKCMTGNAAFPKPPIPLVASVPPDETAPLDMTTRMNNLDAAIKNAVGGGTIQTGLKNAALASVF